MKILKIAGMTLALMGLHFLLGHRDLFIQDLFFNIRGPIKPPDDIHIAAIDDISINVIGNWPWRRARIGELIDSIATCNPSVIYVNIFFRKKGANTLEESAPDIQADNAALAASVYKAGNVILPYLFEEFESDTAASLINTPEAKVYASRFLNVKGGTEGSGVKSAQNLYYPEPGIAEKAMALGLAKIAKSRESQTNLALQVVKYGKNFYPTISIVTAAKFLGIDWKNLELNLDEDRMALGKNITFPLLMDGTAMINFFGGTGAFQRHSASKIMDKNFRKEALRNKIVIVGVTDRALTREAVPSRTPFDKALVSSEVWANIIENTLSRPVTFIDASSLMLTLVLPFFFVLALSVITILCARCAFRRQMLFLILTGMVIALIAFVLFYFGKWVSIVVPLFYLLGLASYFSYRRIKRGPVSSAGVTNSALLQGTAEFNREGRLLRVGRYRIDGEIGSGAMGTVYKAIDPNINRTVAIKILKNKSILTGGRENHDRFIREAQAAGNLSHPNIVTIYDCGDADNVTYIAMEYLEGMCLSEKIAREKKLGMKDTAEIIRQIAEGLSKAHNEGIIHRDIKPSNIMLLADSNRVKIMDFGVAKIADATMTQTGKTLGTPCYMSPEQINADQLDNRSDIFSLGVIAYECLTGKHPFSGDNLSSLSYSILNKNPENVTALNPDVNPAADLVFSKVLSKDRNERYQDAKEFAQSLKDALS